MNENSNENNIIFAVLQNCTQNVYITFREIKLICGIILRSCYVEEIKSSYVILHDKLNTYYSE